MPLVSIWLPNDSYADVATHARGLGQTVEEYGGRALQHPHVLTLATAVIGEDLDHESAPYLDKRAA